MVIAGENLLSCEITIIATTIRGVEDGGGVRETVTKELKYNLTNLVTFV